MSQKFAIDEKVTVLIVGQKLIGKITQYFPEKQSYSVFVDFGLNECDTLTIHQTSIKKGK